MCKILIQFQLIWYPNTKDRGASSNCIENVTLEKGRSRHGNPASKNAHKHTNTGCLWPSLLWLIYLCQLDDQYTGFSNTSGPGFIEPPTEFCRESYSNSNVLCMYLKMAPN